MTGIFLLPLKIHSLPISTYPYSVFCPEKLTFFFYKTELSCLLASCWSLAREEPRDEKVKGRWGQNCCLPVSSLFWQPTPRDCLLLLHSYCKSHTWPWGLTSKRRRIHLGSPHHKFKNKVFISKILDLVLFWRCHLFPISTQTPRGPTFNHIEAVHMLALPHVHVLKPGP